MQRDEIKRALNLKGSGVTAISKELAVRSSTVSSVIARNAASLRIEAAIAAKIGRPLHEVFPEKYRPEVA
jgi:lambda repressor-like predicted transcriptional regulator